MPTIVRRHCLALIPLVVFFFVASVGSANAASETASIPAGPMAVGFKSFIRRDRSRAYADRASSQSKGDRPIVFAIWYPAAVPASAPRMKRGEYLDLENLTDEDREFAARLARKATEVWLDEVVDAEVLLTTAKHEALLSAYRQAETSAHRDAPPLAGTFPLVIYHPGLGATLEDMSPLLEHLASHGYVAVASAFQPSDPAFMNVDADVDRSKNDVAFIVSQMRRDPQVNADRIALMGHSFGGIASMATAMWNPLISAVVTFDSTLDYNKVADLPLSQADLGVFREPTRFLAPALIMARPAAKFDLVRTFTESDRLVMHVDAIDHNAFLWHGVAGAQLRHDPTASKRLDLYRTLVVSTRNFLDATLKGNAGAATALEARAGKGKGAGPSLEHLAAAKHAPSVMELVAAVCTHDRKDGTQWLKKSAREVPADVLNDVVRALEERSRNAEALDVALLNVKVHPDRYDAHGRLGDVYLRRKDWTNALARYRQTLSVLKAASYPNDYKAENTKSIEVRIERVEALRDLAAKSP